MKVKMVNQMSEVHTFSILDNSIDLFNEWSLALGRKSFLLNKEKKEVKETRKKTEIHRPEKLAGHVTRRAANFQFVLLLRS